MVVLVLVLAVPTLANAEASHVVAPGESLSSVAAADGLSVSRLAAANGISSESGLVAGSILAIPSAETGAVAEAGAEAPATEPAGPEAAGAYVVQPGDTLSAIAARAGLSVESLAALNGLDPEGVLLAGTAVRLAGSSEAASAPEGEGPTAEAPVATEETIAPSEVGTIAAENGVPSWFAEAIANQESGFNNGVTSGSDARGVMQILPETWSWIRARSGGVATRPGIGGLERARGSADASLAAE